MNERKHWNKIGKNYEGEIFNVFESDLKGKITEYLQRHANPNHTALDFGCGTGRAFSYLTPNFKTVYGLDISDDLLTEANGWGYKNVVLQQADLALPNVKLPQVDLVFSCNVIMLPKPRQNRAMLNNVSRALKPRGSAVIVIPSLDSVLFSSQRLIQWYEKEGIAPEKISESEFAYYKNKRNILNGIIHIDKVPTRHYSQSELQLVFKEANLQVRAIDKVEYPWSTEFDSPPKWMQAPYPWDWLVECTKV